AQRQPEAARIAGRTPARRGADAPPPHGRVRRASRGPPGAGCPAPSWPAHWHVVGDDVLRLDRDLPGKHLAPLPARPPGWPGGAAGNRGYTLMSTRRAPAEATALQDEIRRTGVVLSWLAPSAWNLIAAAVGPVRRSPVAALYWCWRRPQLRRQLQKLPSSSLQ